MWFNKLSGHGDKTMRDLISEAYALRVAPGFKGQPLDNDNNNNNNNNDNNKSLFSQELHRILSSQMQ